MSRRTDPGKVITVFVLVALAVVAAALSPKAKAAPPTPLEVVDSALRATFSPTMSAHLEDTDRVLSILDYSDSLHHLPPGAEPEIIERLAAFANAHYHGPAVQAIEVQIIDMKMGAMDPSQPPRITHGVFLPQLLDGRATADTIDARRFHARTPPQPDGNVRVTYDGTHIHLASDTTVAVAPFAQAEIDSIIRTLPLAKGYAARLPLYAIHGIGGDFRWESIYVVGADSACRCWRVNTVEAPYGGFHRIQVPLKP
jgi:hypothetical protein